jgi:HK97 family phage major capsid protein
MDTANATRIAEILKDPRAQNMQRTAEFSRASVNLEERTVELSFASETAVDRWFGREILDMTPSSVDLARMNNGAALLLNHDWDRQVGVVVRSWIDTTTKKARAVVKLSRSDEGEDILRDIHDGIRTLVSVGYVIRKMVRESVDGDVETHRAMLWEPFEVSLVSVPADPLVGVGRSKPGDKPLTTIQIMDTSLSVAPPAPPAAKDDLARIKDINTACEVIVQRNQPHAEAIRAVARKCLETGDTVIEFNRTVLADVLKTEPIAPITQRGAAIGMSPKERKRYSVLRAIRCALDNRPLDGLERECSDEVANKLEREPQGFFLPDEIVADSYAAKRQTRTLLATSVADGGYTVGEELLASEFVELLRNNTVVMQAGARYISGLTGDVTIPRQLTGAVIYWVSETGSITQSSATFGQIVGRPRRIGTSVPYSKQFLAQTSLGAEAFVVQDSDASIAVDLDRVALRGIGGSEPLGIANLASAERSTAVTFSGAATWAKYLEFFANVAGNNALLGTPSYVASVASAVKAMSISKFGSGTADPIWKDGKVGPFPAYWTTQLLTSATPVANMVIFGDFSQVLFLEWAGRDVVVDPYSGKKEGTVEVTIQRLMDVVIRRGKSFATSTDTGAA